jgi:type I restriction enzyme M protein
MDQATHNRIVSFLWGIADDVLRDLFKRGKDPDVILPMCVLQRARGFTTSRHLYCAI